jgi:putative flippase GtrA
LIGQIIAGIVTACCTFFLSKHFVFKVREEENEIKIETEFKL